MLYAFVRQFDPHRKLIKARCGICGVPIREVPARYPHRVCRWCEKRTVNSKGREPWHDSGKDEGENPVFIDGKQCWRRYRFGGYVTMRDRDNCRTLGQFYKLNDWPPRKFWK